MKTLKYFFFACAALLTASCMDGDWNTPSEEKMLDSYGNPSIEITNLITIADLKAQYQNEIDNKGLREVKKPTQIQAVVVGNDEGGNIYNAIYLQDNTGAIKVTIGQSGLYGPFGVGQTVVVELQGLYVGGYGQEPQIGTSYTNASGVTSVGRLSRYEWANHYKLVPSVPGLIVAPTEVKFNLNSLDMTDDCCKLITLKGVELSEADGTAVFAPTDGSVTLTSNCANRFINGASNVVLRTSTYAKFANLPMPTGRVDITGIASRYANTWQIYMRTGNDICPTSLSPEDLPVVVDPKGTGTKDDPYNVVGVLNYIKTLGADKQSDDIYIEGIITSIASIGTDDTFGNATYYISDTEDGTNGSFYIYRGYGVNGQKFNEPGATLIKVNDKVLLKTKVVNYKGTTPETVQNSCIIVKLNGEGGGGDEPSGETLGTKDAPLNIAQALDYINALDDGAETEQFAFVKGKVVKVTTSQANFDKYKNLNYLISEDGTDGTTITVYSGDGLDGEKFKSITDLEPGDEVVVYGKLYKYVNKDGKMTPEINKGNYLVSLVKGSGGGGGDGDDPSGDGVSKTIDGTTVTLTNTAVTASSTTVSVDFSAQGWANSDPATTVTLSDGTTITFIQGEATNPPKYYDATKGVRFYATNGMTITATSKAIAKVVMYCDNYSGTDYVGNDMLYGSASGTSMTIINDYTSASGGVQLRVKTMEITYAE